MKRTDVLKLEALSHLTARQLGERDAKLAKQVDARLIDRANRKLVRDFEGADEPARKLIAGLRIDAKDLRSGRTIREMLGDAVAPVKGVKGKGKAKPTQEPVNLAPILGAEKPGEATIDGLAGMDLPIAIHPEFKPQLAAAQLFRFADAFALAPALVEPLVEADVRLEHLDTSKLERLVANKTINAKTATRLADATSTFRVLDENPQLVSAAAAHLKVDQLSPSDLLQLDSAGFAKLIKKGKLEPPIGLDADAWAEGLHRKVLNLSPSLGLAATLRRAETNVDFAKFLERNKGTEVLALDFSAPDVVANIKFGTNSAGKRLELLNTAKSYQRLWAVTDDILDTQALVAAGYTTAFKMAEVNVQTLVDQSGLTFDIAQGYWDKSRKIATSVTGFTGTIIDLLHGGVQGHRGWKPVDRHRRISGRDSRVRRPVWRARLL